MEIVAKVLLFVVEKFEICEYKIRKGPLSLKSSNFCDLFADN